MKHKGFLCTPKYALSASSEIGRNPYINLVKSIIHYYCCSLYESSTLPWKCWCLVLWRGEVPLLSYRHLHLFLMHLSMQSPTPPLLPPREGSGFVTDGLQKMHPQCQNVWIIPYKPPTISPVCTTGQEQLIMLLKIM